MSTSTPRARRRVSQRSAAPPVTLRGQAVSAAAPVHSKAGTGPELFIGLVGAIGADLGRVRRALDKYLSEVDFGTRHVKLIDLLGDSGSINQTRVDKRYAARMDAGNAFRRKTGRPDALVMLGMGEVQGRRHKEMGNEEEPIPRCAFIFDSLKTPAEVETLRDTYGNNCIVISAYHPKQSRTDLLAEKIARSIRDSDVDRHKAAATGLVYRDEVEHGDRFGQNIRDTFPLADVFVDASSDATVNSAIARFVELLFGHPIRTPFKDEHGMFQAFGACLRSSSAGRQVGAAITTRDGDVVAIGTNEVAKAHGGQYWPVPDGEEDHRDYTRPTDSSVSMVQSIMTDLLARMKKKQWLSDEMQARAPEDLADLAREELLRALQITDGDRESLAQKALVQNLLEYLRPVHAEMAALSSAARRGVSVDGCTLYSTTLPCHECAKHIVSAGIRKVVFIDPYP